MLGGQDVKIHEEIGLVLPAGTPELSNRKIFQDDKEAQSMVRMRVGQDGGVERRHAPVEELRKQARSSEVPPVEIEGASAVHEDGVPAPAQKQGIPLPHVEGLEPEAARRPRWRSLFSEG